jgi:hypothetical protein
MGGIGFFGIIGGIFGNSIKYVCKIKKYDFEF